MTAWIVRAGKFGEREDWAIEHHIAGGGFTEIPNMTKVATRDDARPSSTPRFPVHDDATSDRHRAPSAIRDGITLAT